MKRHAAPFVLLWFGGLAATAGCSQPAQAPADLIVRNGVVFPADGTETMFEALAVTGKTIALVGTSAEVDRLRGPKTNVIDAAGGAVVPGFNDPHFHMFLELESGPLNLLGDTTLAGIQRHIREYAATFSGPWIVGQGWLYSPFPGYLPTRRQLDAVVPDRPAFIRSYDYHTAWVNSKALQLAGITRTTRDPPFGVIQRDSSGEPTGVLKDDAQGIVMGLLPRPTADERLRTISVVVPRLHAAGITSIHTADSDPAHFTAFAAARAAGSLRLRVAAAISPSPLFALNSHRRMDDGAVDDLDRLRRAYPPDESFKIDAIKLLADGVVEGHTAALLAPYAEGPPAPVTLARPPGELRRIVALLDRRGWPMMIHAIGDRAVREVLDAYEAAARTNAAPPAGRRHRVEHLETIDPSDMPRFGALGVLASIHPDGWDGADPPASLMKVWQGALGPDRVARSNAWAPIALAGGRVLLGSDYPAAGLDPIPRLYAAASPDASDGHPGAQLTMRAAVEAYTRWPAYAEFSDTIKGTLAPGKRADIAVLSKNIFAVPLPPVQSVSVTATILDGQVVFRRR